MQKGMLTLQLDSLIKQFYQAFAQYKPQKAHHLGLLLTDTQLAEIEQGELKNISASTLLDYLESVGTDSKDVVTQTHNEIKYLLPRMVQLFDQRQEITLMEETSFDSLHLEDKSLWTITEVDLITQFALTHFKKTLLIDDDAPYTMWNESPELLMVMWVRAGLNETLFLNTWEQITTSKSLLCFVGVLYQVKDGKYQNSFAPKQLARDLATWPYSTRVIKLFQEKARQLIASDEEIDEEDRRVFDFLLDLV